MRISASVLFHTSLRSLPVVRIQPRKGGRLVGPESILTRGADVTSVDVPVVGGHAGVTILPLFSQVHDNLAAPTLLKRLVLKSSFGRAILRCTATSSLA